MDLPALVALEARCFLDVDRFPPRTWRRLMANPSGSAVLLVHGRRGAPIAGIIGLCRAGSTVCRIYSLAVDPAARGRGLASALVRSLARRVRGRCRTLSLEVRAGNGPALELYRRFGFRVTDALPRYYGDGATGLRLRVAISDLEAC